MKTLVVYFSRKGRTAAVAQEIAHNEQADIEEITTKEHTKGWLGFWWCGRFGMHRWSMEISEAKFPCENYDQVILVSPVWVFTLSSPLWAYIKREKGKIKRVQYAFVHFSPFMHYKKTIAKMDQILAIKHEKALSFARPLGFKLFSSKAD